MPEHPPHPALPNTTEPSVEERFQRGMYLRSVGNHPAAMRAFVDALLADASHLPSLLGLGETLVALQRWDDAERAFDRARALHPGEPAAEAGYRLVQRRRVEQRTQRRAPQVVLVPNERSARPARPWTLPLLGFLVFAAGVAVYVWVGLATHFVMGIAAALAVIGALTGAALLFADNRGAALRALSRGMGYGLALLAAAAVLSLTIALATAAG